MVNNAYSDGSLNVESYPSEIFPGIVVHIADRAEFTPPKRSNRGRLPVNCLRNKIDNPEGKLKPGMPADVNIKPVLK